LKGYFAKQLLSKSNRAISFFFLALALAGKKKRNKKKQEEEEDILLITGLCPLMSASHFQENKN
jgi:hypothetical protein